MKIKHFTILIFSNCVILKIILYLPHQLFALKLNQSLIVMDPTRLKPDALEYYMDLIDHVAVSFHDILLDQLQWEDRQNQYQFSRRMNDEWKKLQSIM